MAFKLNHMTKGIKAMTEAEEILLARVLAFKHQNSQTNDNLLDAALENMESPQLKNVCAKLSSELVESVEIACRILDMSKRKFIEMALVDLLEKYENLTAQYDIFEPFEQQEEGGKTRV